MFMVKGFFFFLSVTVKFFLIHNGKKIIINIDLKNNICIGDKKKNNH